MLKKVMTPVGFEPTHPKIVELESTALDHSAKVSLDNSIVGDVIIAQFDL